jgi:hypothetical protein
VSGGAQECARAAEWFKATLPQILFSLQRNNETGSLFRDVSCGARMSAGCNHGFRTTAVMPYGSSSREPKEGLVNTQMEMIMTYRFTYLAVAGVLAVASTLPASAAVRRHAVIVPETTSASVQMNVGFAPPDVPPTAGSNEGDWRSGIVYNRLNEY